MADKPPSLDTLFRDAVAAIDAGDALALERLLAEHPRLARDRLKSPGTWLSDKIGGAPKGFFKHPYLLWFVAEDPGRNGKLPPNIAQLTRSIIEAARREGAKHLQEQLDYTLRLVAWSGVAAQCGVQLELIDVLVDAGASPDGVPDNALVNGHFAAAEHLLARGAPLTLSTALLLGRWDDVARLAGAADAKEKQSGFVLAALNGKDEALRRMIGLGADVNRPSADLYAHATPLHHAVCSGSLDAVKVLVEAGASLSVRDKAEKATPREWAEYYRGERPSGARSKRYAEIAAYLRERESRFD